MRISSEADISGGTSHKIKRHLLLGRKAMADLDITLPTKVHIVKAMIFPVVMYSCEHWTIRKAEHQRTDAFKLWYWQRHLRVPWTAKRSNVSSLKEINSEYSLKGLHALGPLRGKSTLEKPRVGP